MNAKRYTVGEVCELAGVQRSFLVRCFRAHWVSPAYPAESELDEKDLARLRLIAELLGDFGANEEAVPLILHLLDQLYTLRDAPFPKRAPTRILLR